MSTIIISLLSGILTTGVLATWAYVRSKFKKQKNESNAMKDGIKALLRDRLIHSFNYYKELGYAPIYARENFQSMYDEYHNLGGNGVIDDLYEKFMDLPTRKQQKINK